MNRSFNLPLIGRLPAKGKAAAAVAIVLGLAGAAFFLPPALSGMRAAPLAPAEPAIAVEPAAKAKPAAKPLVKVASAIGVASTADVQPAAAPEVTVKFPLKISGNKRYLVDAKGKRFLIHGDAAWSLIGQLTRAEVKKYLDDRAKRGFNTILVSLLEHRFSTNAPANAYHERPFLTPGNFTTPNEKYFAHADWVIKQAAKRGILVLLTPAYLGWQGGSDGWYQEMVANGATKLRTYGEYVGKRYAGFKNILWVEGGDYSAPRMDLVAAVANGIRAFDKRALHTMHCGPEDSAFDCAGNQSWLDVNSVYTYGPVVNDARPEYARNPVRPYFLIESTYENEHGATTRLLRTQAYQANLSGAAGQVFGNDPIWHFDGPGLNAPPTTWQKALSGQGSKSMTALRKLFDSLAWQKLVPDTTASVLVGGQGSGDSRAVAALDKTRTFGLVYVPSSRSITIDLDRFSENKVKARWYDPANGKYKAISGSPFKTSGKKSFTTPGSNSSGAGDWVLVLGRL